MTKPKPSRPYPGGVREEEWPLRWPSAPYGAKTWRAWSLRVARAFPEAAKAGWREFKLCCKSGPFNG